jgi:hypothetical protein
VAEQAADGFTRMIASASRELASVGNLAARDRSNLSDLDRRHDGRVAVEGREFDLERLAVVVGVHDSSDIAGHQACVGDGSRQYDPIVLPNHRALRWNLNVGRGTARLRDGHALRLEAIEVKRDSALHVSFDFVAGARAGMQRAAVKISARRRGSESAPRRSRARRALDGDRASFDGDASSFECFENHRPAQHRSRRCVVPNARTDST